MVKYDSIKSRNPQRKTGDKMGQNVCYNKATASQAHRTPERCLPDTAPAEAAGDMLVSSTSWCLAEAQGRLVLAEYERTNQV